VIELKIRFLACFIILFFSFAWSGSAEVPVDKDALQERKVILQREYLDGELSEEKITEWFGSIKELKNKYKGWKVLEQTKDHLVLHKMENDISPLLKANGYFGISEDGTLSIYNGKPEHDKVIHTFFQIDVGKLEVYQQEELQNGIQIISKDQFKSLMNEYQEYAVQPN
jgi:forespore regulator of the sigma-K checkpoint